MKIIDIESWKRKEHYAFFSKMKSPFFGIVAKVDATACYRYAKENKESFFAHYLHKSMVAVNGVPELKYRIVGQDVVQFDTLDAGSTIARQDGTFGFAYIPFNASFEVFNASLQLEIQEVQNSQGLRLSNDDLDVNLIRHSTFPWGSFSGLLHPTNFDPTDSIPKITFGKGILEQGKFMLPVSIEAHHGLADGLHLGQYLQNFQDALDSY